jgi:hypothetical protein
MRVNWSEGKHRSQRLHPRDFLSPRGSTLPDRNVWQPPFAAHCGLSPKAKVRVHRWDERRAWGREDTCGGWPAGDLRKFIEGYLAAQWRLSDWENGCPGGEERLYVSGYKELSGEITCLAAERGYEIRVTNQGQLRSWESAEVALRERDRQSLANPM